MGYTLGEPTVQQYFDANGDPLALGTIEFYLWNTSTPTPVYSDSTGTSAGTSVTLDNLGAPENSGTAIALFFDDGIVYKIQRKTSAGTEIDPTIGPYYGHGGGAGTIISIDVIDVNGSDSLYDYVGYANGQQVSVGGYWTIGDGGGGRFYWNSTDTGADDGGLTILPTGHTGAGRWIRLGTEDGTSCHAAMFGVVPARTDAQNNTSATALLASSITTVEWGAGVYQLTGGLTISNDATKWTGSGSIGQSGSAERTTIRFTGSGWGLTFGDGTAQNYSAPTFEDIVFQDSGGYTDESSASVTTGGLRFWSASQGRISNCGFHGFPIAVQFYGMDELETGQRECQYWEIEGLKGYFNKTATLDFVNCFNMNVWGGQIQGADAPGRDYLAGSTGIRVRLLGGGGSNAIRLFGCNSQFVETSYLIDGTGTGTLQRVDLETCRAEACYVGVDIINANRCGVSNFGIGNTILNTGPKTIPHGIGVRVDADSDFCEIDITQANDVEVDYVSENKRYNTYQNPNHAKYITSPNHYYRHNITSATYQIKDDDVFIEYTGTQTTATITLPEIAAAATTWAATTAYVIDDEVINGKNIYRCTTGGTSAGSGGPTGTGTGIADGTVVWDYARQDDTLAEFDGRSIYVAMNSTDTVTLDRGGSSNIIREGANRTYTSLPMIRGVCYHLIGSSRGNGEWWLQGMQKSGAIADLNQTISGPSNAEVQAISDKVDGILAALRTAGLMVP